jgi:hypothetical protein
MGEDNDQGIMNPLLITQAGSRGGGIAMMSEQPKNAVGKLFGENFEIAVSGRMRHECALFEELNFVWREAQAEANLAYEAWRRYPCLEAYAVYRAAQDQADAAQDGLADCWRQLAA